MATADIPALETNVLMFDQQGTVVDMQGGVTTLTMPVSAGSLG